MKLKNLYQKFLFSSLFIVLEFLLIHPQVQAIVTNPAAGSLGESSGAEDGSKFVSYVVYLWKVSINLGALAVIAFFIFGAVEWMTAGSDTKKTESARNRMTNAVVGLIILVASFTLISFISKVFFGDSFDILNLTLPTYN
jgi:hypothetical protein